MFDDYIIKVIIPALDEAKSIGKVLSAIPGWVDEIIVVDNGSSDNTAQIARACGAHVVREMQRGYGRACLAGLAALDRCDIVVFLDADYSDYPEDMPNLLKPIIYQGYDIVLGSRMTGQHGSGCFTFPQYFGTSLTCCLIRIIWAHTFTDLGPFRAIRFSSLQALKMQDQDYGWTVEMQIKALLKHLRIKEVPVRYRPRIGKSKISGTVKGVIRAGLKIMTTITRFALAPPAGNTCRPDRLVIYTRFPVPGKAKTRLIPALGSLGAAELHRQLTEGTLEKARIWAGRQEADLEVRYSGCRESSIRRWLGPDLTYVVQDKGDLGTGIAGAFHHAFADGCRRVLLIGTDIFHHSVQLMQEALKALNENDLVLGPTRDGGYWLIGLRQETNLFTGISWGTSHVLQQTLARAAALNLSVYQLPPLDDIDRPEDLTILEPTLRNSKIVISVIIPTLNEAANIAAAIRSAQNENTEIIVVDGGSTDNTRSQAASLGVRVLTCPAGRARQMNCGAAVAQGRILLFLHADTCLPPGYQDKVFHAMLDPRTVGGGFAWQTDIPGRVMAFAAWAVYIRTRYQQEPWGDQAVFVRKSVFDRIGGFADTPIAEDWHFIKKLKQQGHITALPQPVITSGRRWSRIGLWRTFIINQVIAAGCRLSISPHFLARLYYTDYT